MGKNQRRPAPEKIRFSIGSKLLTIISLLVFISLSSITAFVSWYVREDLKKAAENNNLEVNRRLAIETETTVINVRSSSRMFMQTMAAGQQQVADFFFAENPQIAALFISGKQEQLFVNKLFFVSREIKADIAAFYF